MAENITDDNLILDFILHLRTVEGLSKNTCISYQNDLELFSKNLKGEIYISKVSTNNILDYIQKRVEDGIGKTTNSRIQSSLQKFYNYLLLEDIISENPMGTIKRPKQIRSVPKSVSEEDVENLLKAPDLTTVIGIRDKAMLEILYAAGLRVSELINIKLFDLDLNSGILKIMGKGSKERIVPIGEYATDWVNQYLEQRAKLLNKKASDYLFLSKRGTPMVRQTFWLCIKKYALLAGITTSLSPHSLRHAFATHLINHGADLRSVQKLLGHSDITTTEIYIYVANDRLKDIHKKHHPRG